MKAVLGITQDHEIVSAVKSGHFITIEEANAMTYDDAFQRSNMVFMRPFWDSPTHIYNLNLCKTFREHFILLNPEYGGHTEQIEAHFYQRLRLLKTLISRHSPA